MIRRRGQPRCTPQRRTPDRWLWSSVSTDQAGKQDEECSDAVDYLTFFCLIVKVDAWKRIASVNEIVEHVCLKLDH